MTCTLDCDNWPIDTLDEAYRYIKHVVFEHSGYEEDK